MPTEEADNDIAIPSPPPSRPDGPMAFEHMARAVEGMTAELRGMRADLRVVLNELSGAMRRLAEHEVRLTEVEILSKLKAKEKRHAAKPR